MSGQHHYRERSDYLTRSQFSAPSNSPRIPRTSTQCRFGILSVHRNKQWDVSSGKLGMSGVMSAFGAAPRRTFGEGLDGPAGLGNPSASPPSGASDCGGFSRLTRTYLLFCSMTSFRFDFVNLEKESGETQTVVCDSSNSDIGD